MHKYEYSVVVFNLTRPLTAHITHVQSDGEHRTEEVAFESATDVEAQLNSRWQFIAKMGEEGWELCAVDFANYFFKRQKGEENS